MTTSTSRRAPSPWTSQASPTPTPVPISRTRPPLRYRRGQCRQQPAHLGLAGVLETGAGGSFVGGQNAAGKLLAVGHKEHHARHRGAGGIALPMGLPDPAVIAALGAEVALVHARLDHLQAQLSRLGAYGQRRRRLHDRAHQADLAVELPELRRGQLAQRLDGDGEPAAERRWCHSPPTTPSTSRTG